VSGAVSPGPSRHAFGEFAAALVLAVPLLWGLVQRRTLQRWEETENISAAAAFQEKRNDAAMVLGTYGIVFMVLAVTA
jgi:hypothetical protein